MVIRLAVSRAVIGLCAAAAATLAAGEALAQANVLKECGSQYQAAKAANELAGQGWQDFLKACRTRLKEAASPAPENKPAEAAAPKAAPAEAVEAKPAPAAEAPAPKAEPAKPAAAAPVANPLKAPTPAAEAPKEAPAASPVQAMKDREKKCAADWKAGKKALLKEDPKLTWPKFWSSCNKKLKEAGA